MKLFIKNLNILQEVAPDIYHVIDMSTNIHVLITSKDIEACLEARDEGIDIPLDELQIGDR